jgi:GMP synthase-like glutamine amidotransferase
MKPLRIHYLQHVPFEGPGYIESWAKSKAHKLSVTRLYEKPEYPNVTEFDWLIVMGGSMSVYDENQYSWLKAEKEFIKSAIEGDKIVIGICLGSQFLAEALGAKVYPNRKKEIGWFPVTKTRQAKKQELLKDIPDSFEVFHWHGDTFDLPPGAVHLFQTDVCPNQAFLFNDKVLGLQFHFETTPVSLNGMICNCRNELTPDDFIQTEQEITAHADLCGRTNVFLTKILDYFAGK